MDPTTKEESVLLDELRDRVSDVDLNEVEFENKNLLRFLRARNGNLDLAEKMIRNYHVRYVADDIKSLLANYQFPDGWENNFYYALTGFDRTGCPIILGTFGQWDVQKEMAAGNKEEFVKMIYFILEQIMTLLRHQSKGKNEMRQVVGVIDLEGLSFRQVTCLDAVDAVIRCLKCFEACYPESLKTIVMVNAPWPFKMGWKLVSPFISENTHAKLMFPGGGKENWKQILTKFADPHQFPQRYGGTAPDSKKMFLGRDGSWSYSENQNEDDDNAAHRYDIL